MGLLNLRYLWQVIGQRKEISELYDTLLGDSVKRVSLGDQTEYNYSYYPVLFDDEHRLQAAVEELSRYDIYPRRYFYPSLNTLPYLKNQQSCPISEDISKRVLCLPLYAGLEKEAIERICSSINNV